MTEMNEKLKEAVRRHLKYIATSSSLLHAKDLAREALTLLTKGEANTWDPMSLPDELDEANTHLAKEWVKKNGNLNGQ